MPVNNKSHAFLPLKTAVLLIQLGTPNQPNYWSVWRFLAEFLSDHRVVRLPRFLWLPLLYLVILPLRSGLSAKKYREIWTEAGSPLLVHSQRQLEKLQIKHPQYKFALAMRYGEPSVASVLQRLIKEGIGKLIVLPLYPQPAQATTASAFDAVADALINMPSYPSMRFINHYADNPAYIDALAKHLKNHWQKNGRADKLLISFHGIPKAVFESGDPYYCYCHKTARLLAEACQLDAEDYQLVFQSRLGRGEWLQPYCQQTIIDLAQLGCKTIDIICPGFAVDCLETLHEIEIEYRDIFLTAGGEQLRYVPALNASDESISALSAVLEEDCIT